MLLSSLMERGFAFTEPLRDDYVVVLPEQPEVYACPIGAAILASASDRQIMIVEMQQHGEFFRMRKRLIAAGVDASFLRLKIACPSCGSSVRSELMGMVMHLTDSYIHLATREYVLAWIRQQEAQYFGATP